MTELSNWDCSSCIYNDVWGYVDNAGNEYAVLGSRTKVHFLDVTNPTSPVLKGEFIGGANSPWRDMKSYDQYVYAVADSGTEGLMIFDMSALPSGAITLASQSNSVFAKAHNIFIDVPNARLYVVGSDTQSNGVIVYSLSDPLNPTVISNIALTGGYVHDIFVQNNTVYCSHGFTGMYIYDMTTPTTPVLLANIDTGEYNHSTWITENGSHLIYAEEVPSGLPLGLIDLSQVGVNNLTITNTFSFPLLAPTHTNVTYHNPFIIDNYAIVSSYLDGVTIMDISNPSSPSLAGWFDTYPSNTNYNSGSGCWGVYPFLPSGNILASDISNGLFVLGTTINLTSDCNNGVMDINETGVDCGGYCAPCYNTLTVDFEADNTTGTSPLTVNFTELSNNEISYQWDFDNDGNIDDTTPNPTYTYTTAGSYTVSLTVADAMGNMLTETKTNYINPNALNCYEDLDGDSFGSNNIVPPGESQCPSGSVTNNTDCDDNNPNDTNIDVNGNPVVGGIYYANASITSKSSIIIGTPGVDKVTFQAGQEVILENGFEALAGSDFTALIETCDNPPMPSDIDMDGILNYQDNCPFTPTVGLDFDGIDDYISVPHNNATNFSANQNFTIELWIKMPSTPQPNNNPIDVSIMEKWSGSGGYPYVLRYKKVINKIAFARYDGFNVSYLTTTTSFNDDTWHHLAVVKVGSILQMYVDGQLESSTADNVTSGSNNSPIHIGQRGANNHYWKGTLDDLRFWNVARTINEIQNNKNQELSGAEASLVGYYRFNEGTPNLDNSAVTNTIIDESATTNNGTLVNFAKTSTLSNWIIGAAVNFLDSDNDGQGDPCDVSPFTAAPAVTLEQASTNNEEEIDQKKIEQSNLVEIENTAKEMPIQFSIFPNPLSEQTMIAYTLQKEEQIYLTIYDGQGRLVQSLLQSMVQSKGQHQQSVDASKLKSGIYMVVLKTTNEVLTARMVVIR